jgi:hypothetical protein
VKFLSILTALMVSGALSAQITESKVNARVILFGEAIQTRSILLAQGVTDQANFQTGPGIRLMGQTTFDSPWYWELAGRFSSKAYMVTNRDIATAPPSNVLDMTKVRIEYSYWSVGAGYLIPLGQAADFGIHLEGRDETINPKGQYSSTGGGTANIDAMTAYFRPWVRLSLDLKLKTGSITTILGGDGSFTPLRTKQQNIMPLSQIDSQTMRALAPTWSASLYAGFQF